jgi:hypothetical protein
MENKKGLNLCLLMFEKVLDTRKSNYASEIGIYVFVLHCYDVKSLIIALKKLPPTDIEKYTALIKFLQDELYNASVRYEQ